MSAIENKAREWSKQQQDIFSWFGKKQPVFQKRNLLARARAGTGKTTTLLEAINFAPELSILLCAFNKKIATELTQKLRNPRAEAKTLHSVGFKYVMRNWKNIKLDNDRGYNIAKSELGTEAPDEVLRAVTRLASLAKGAAPFPTVQQLVELCQNHEISLDEEWQEEGWTDEIIAGYAMRCMEKACIFNGTLDFDDMIFVPLRNKWVRGWYDMVVVDEAQDMNASQLLLAQRVCKPTGRIVVVGDDRQAIYGFRGADPGSIERLKLELDAQELNLTITYRCPKIVVAEAAQLVPDYQAAPTAPDGSITRCNFEKMADMAQPGDFVLSRKNAPLAKACLRLLRMGKRAKIEGREIGQGLVKLVEKLRARTMPDFLKKLAVWEERQVKHVEVSQVKNPQVKIDYIRDQAETLRYLAEGLSGMKELTARITSLFSDNGEAASSMILCSSVHRAKGLEADRVFVFTDTLIHNGPIEEQNIKYVAITRAKRDLVWVDGIQ